MNYDDLAQRARELGYRDKLKLAQLLLQLAVKEEEAQNPDRRVGPKHGSPVADESVEYVAPRLLKLRPNKKEGVLNSISAMYQFQGGISEVDRERIYRGLLRCGVIQEGPNGKVAYVSPREA